MIYKYICYDIFYNFYLFLSRFIDEIEIGKRVYFSSLYLKFFFRFDGIFVVTYFIVRNVNVDFRFLIGIAGFFLIYDFRYNFLYMCVNFLFSLI